MTANAASRNESACICKVDGRLRDDRADDLRRDPVSAETDQDPVLVETAPDRVSTTDPVAIAQDRVSAVIVETTDRDRLMAATDQVLAVVEIVRARPMVAVATAQVETTVRARKATDALTRRAGRWDKTKTVAVRIVHALHSVGAIDRLTVADVRHKAGAAHDLAETDRAVETDHARKATDRPTAAIVRAPRSAGIARARPMAVVTVRDSAADAPHKAADFGAVAAGAETRRADRSTMAAVGKVAEVVRPTDQHKNRGIKNTDS